MAKQSLGILFFLVLGLGDLSSQNLPSRKLIREGNKYFADSAWTRAEEKYLSALSNDTSEWSAKYNLSNTYYKQEKWPEAEKELLKLQDASASQLNKASKWHNLGNAYYQQENLEKALEAYQEALRLNPSDQETRHNYILTKQKLQQQQNQDQKQNKEQEKEEQEKQDQQNEDKDQQDQNQDQKDAGNEDPDKQEPQESQPKELSKEQAAKLLKAIQDKERKLQENMNLKKMKGQTIKTEKDW